MADTRIIRGTKCYYHHTSYCRRYVSRRKENPEEPGTLGYYEKYSGKFGEGFREFLPNWASSQFSYVVYWIKA